MLKALHSLQKENQRLQEQIMTLTAKKERLQLLNVQLSVPFPVVTSSNGPGSQAQYILPANGEGTGAEGTGGRVPVPWGWHRGHSRGDLSSLVATLGSSPDPAPSLLSPPVCTSDSLSISKSPPCKNSFGIENSLSTSSEVQRPLQPPAAGQGLGRGPAQPQHSVASS